MPARLVGRIVPASWLRRLRRTYRRVAFPAGYFRSITLSDEAIRTRAYESHLYGSLVAWDGHGAFQLFFLRTMGLEPRHTLLDVGCGPLRGGIHAIAYLDRGRYWGIDFNASFIRAAGERTRASGLSEKEPVLRVVDDLDVEDIAQRFDFVLAFSVLNHCTTAQRQRFLGQVSARLAPGGRLYVTHADWYAEGDLHGTDLVLRRTLAAAEDVRPDLRMTDWAWRERRPPVFPILELRRAT